MTASHRVDADVEKIVGRLSLESTVSAARWQAEIHFDAEGRQSLGPVVDPQSSRQNGNGA
jgi:hypothetical protein